MIGKLIGAIAGERIAQHVSGINGPSGALLGTAAAMAVRRLGPLGLIAAAAGGYAFKRYRDRQQAIAARPARVPALS